MPGDEANYRIEYLPEVVKIDIPKLDKKIRNIIKRKFERLIHEPLLGLPLRGNLAGCYKLRISKYRVVYKTYNDQLIILVIAIGKREELAVYKSAEKRI